MSDAAQPATHADVDAGRRPTRGVWCLDASVGMVARIARSGTDWVCVDLQHGVYGRNELIEIARELEGKSSTDLVVRVASAEFTGIGLALDVGARTVIVPQIDSVADARRAVEATFYPPIGRRSWGQLQPTWGGSSVPPGEANDAVTCAVMIESAQALADVEKIAAVPGVGMLFIGPLDLALSLGTTVPALLDAAALDSPIVRIRAAARAHGLRVGAFGGDPDMAEKLSALGLDDVAWYTDGWLLSEGLRVGIAASAAARQPAGY